MISLINKTPGLDSSPVEFYSTFWSKLGPLLIEVFNESVSDGELCNSMKARIMHLVFKKGDRKSLKNWRPISLLNVEYKMYIIILYIDNSPQGVFQWQFTILQEIKPT